MIYEDVLRLPGHLTLQSVESLAEKIREVGSVEYYLGRNLGFTVEAADLWDLREVLATLEVEIESYGVDFEVDKTKVSP